jgi:hypothetical protein
MDRRRPCFFVTPAKEGAELEMAELLLQDRVHADHAARAKQALSQSRIYDLRRLSVDQDGEAVVLRGRVSSFYHKQLAQELVRNEVDGAEVVNSIRVIYSADRRDTAFDRAW